MDANPFLTSAPSNHYDRMVVDIPELYRQFPIEERTRWAHPPTVRLGKFYGLGVLPLGARIRAWKILHRLQLDLEWLKTFQGYWGDVLQGRPLLAPEDFHFLRGLYRIGHQNNQLPDTRDPSIHLAAWQQPELVYLIFHQVFVESLQPKIAPAEWIHKLRAESFCEYGCATAPATMAYRQFFGHKTRAFVLDIPTITLHYAAYRLAQSPTTVPIVLREADRFLPPSGLKVDAVICMAVFEHLLDPILVAHRLAELLKPRGYLIFDFIDTTGGGLDSQRSVEQRTDVLAFINERFEIMFGNPNRHGGMLMTVARLRD
jgi:SAM-dependent methyltransferase